MSSISKERVLPPRWAGRTRLGSGRAIELERASLERASLERASRQHGQALKGQRGFPSNVGKKKSLIQVFMMGNKLCTTQSCVSRSILHDKGH